MTFLFLLHEFNNRWRNPMHFCEKCLKCYFSGNKIFDASDVVFFLITISLQAELQSADDKNRIDQSFSFHLYFNFDHSYFLSSYFLYWQMFFLFCLYKLGQKEKLLLCILKDVGNASWIWEILLIISIIIH